MKAGALVVGIVAALAAYESDALACGGCFTRPEIPTVVTDHRMIWSVSQTQSTLYDQIEYSGSPQDFGWVLPYSGTITVGISAVSLFASLDQSTQTQILPPPKNCPGPSGDCAVPALSDAPNESAGGTDGVTVLASAVVGPYQTVQLAATNPTALNDWLTTNGYNVPDDVKPVVAEYQTEHFNFLALKLVPGKDVQDMRPVRVTTNGANVALPLRMVAAGTGATVGITLWIVAEGRYEPQNFGSFFIAAADISWDWTKNSSNFTDLRAQKEAAGNGAVWEIESAMAVPRAQVGAAIGYGLNDHQSDYLPVTDASGATTATAVQARDQDFDTLYAGIPAGSEHVTRIRSDLARAALSQDLLLHAAVDQTELSNIRQVTKELNEPTCPIYDGCNQTGTAPRSKAISETNDNDGCAATSTRTPSTWLALGVGFGLVALMRKLRRR